MTERKEMREGRTSEGGKNVGVERAEKKRGEIGERTRGGQPAKREKVTGHVEIGVASWLMERVCFNKGSESLRSWFASVLVRARVGGPCFSPTGMLGPTQRCEVRALTPSLSKSPPHVCHRQGTGAVHTGSRMQRPMVDSFAQFVNRKRNTQFTTTSCRNSSFTA